MTADMVYPWRTGAQKGLGLQGLKSDSWVKVRPNVGGGPFE
jgi:hypothetical protein